MFLPASNPSFGSSSPCGALNLNGLPSLPVMLSTAGLKVMLPANTRAVTISGEATKEWVASLPSLRAVKFLGGSKSDDAAVVMMVMMAMMMQC